MPNTPQVSVCIALYNHEQFLSQTLESVLAQTFRDFEIIVVDDGSSDGSLKLLKSYAARYPQIKVITHPNRSNKGISATTNLAIQESQGAYIAFIGSDDTWCHDRLERQVELLQKDLSLGLIYSSTYIIDKAGHRMPEILRTTDISAESDPFAAMVRRNRIPALTVIVRHECFEQLGMFDETVVYSDWEMWLRIMAHWKVGFVDEPLAEYRVHDFNTSVGIKSELHLRHNLTALIALRQRASVVGGNLATPRVQALLNLQIAQLSFYLKDMAEVSQSLAAGFEIDPSLYANADRLAQYLYVQKYDSLESLPEETAEWDYSLCFLENLSPNVRKAFVRRVKKGLAAQECARVAFGCHQTDMHKARQMVIKCLLNNPRQIADKNLRWLLRRTLVGYTTMSQISRIRKRLLVL